MNGDETVGQVARVVVALDASPHSVAALKAAAELAAVLRADVEGLFVEDSDLFSVCGLPYGREVCSFTATVRSIDVAGMERQLRARAAQIEESLRQIAARAAVNWTFTVRRGSVADELLAASRHAALMSVGRAGRHGRRGLGSIAQSLVEQSQSPLLISTEGSGPQYPLVVLFTGSESSRRALALALRLTGEPARLRIALWPSADPSASPEHLERQARAVLAAARPPSAEGGAARAGAAEPALIRLGGSEDPLAALRVVGGGTLVVPHELAALTTSLRESALLVP